MITIQKFEVVRDDWPGENHRTVILELRVPTTIFLNHVVVFPTATLEEFLASLLPTLPRDSVEHILAAATAARLTR